MKAMVLAAGFGKRLGALTEDRPKALVKVAGKPLIDYVLEKLRLAGFKEIVINLHFKAQMIQEALGNGERYGLSIQYSDEDDILETGGGIANALPLLGDEPFLLMSSDIFTEFDLASLREYDLGKDEAHCVMVPTPQAKTRHDYSIDKDNRLIPASEQGVTYGNIGVISPKLIRRLIGKRYFRLVEALDLGVSHDLISAELYQGPWYNCGTSEDLKALEDFFETRKVV